MKASFAAISGRFRVEFDIADLSDREKAELLHALVWQAVPELINQPANKPAVDLIDKALKRLYGTDDQAM